MVLSAGEGSTFAIMPGSVTTAGQVSTINFKIDPTMFTAPRKNGKLVLGVDVAAATSSTEQLDDSDTHSRDRLDHRSFRPCRTRLNTPNTTQRSPRQISSAIRPTTAVLFSVTAPKTGQPAADYSVQVKGLDSTTGQFLLGFYLPGDVAGTGTVTKADIQTIKKSIGMTAQNSSIQFRRGRQSRRSHQRPRREDRAKKIWGPRPRSARSYR